MEIEKVGHKTVITLTAMEGLSMCADLLKQVMYSVTLETFSCYSTAIIGLRGKGKKARNYPEVLQVNIEGKRP